MKEKQILIETIEEAKTAAKVSKILLEKAYKQIEAFRGLEEEFDEEQKLFLHVVYSRLEDSAYMIDFSAKRVKEDFPDPLSDEHLEVYKEIREMAKECLALQTEAHKELYSKRNPEGLLRVYRNSQATEAIKLLKKEKKEKDCSIVALYEALAEKEHAAFKSFVKRLNIDYKFFL